MFSEHKKDCLFFRFTGSYMLDSGVQLENFIEAIYDWFKFEPSKDIANWMSGFNLLKSYNYHANTQSKSSDIFR